MIMLSKLHRLPKTGEMIALDGDFYCYYLEKPKESELDLKKCVVSNVTRFY